MNRRSFLAGVGTLAGGIAIEQAIPFNRVWSFPSKIVIAPTLRVPSFYARQALELLKKNLMLNMHYDICMPYRLDRQLQVMMTVSSLRFYSEPQEDTVGWRIGPMMEVLADKIKQDCPAGIPIVMAAPTNPYPDKIAATATDGLIGLRCMQTDDLSTMQTRLQFDVLYPINS